MSGRRLPNRRTPRKIILERVYTRDAKVPLVADDWDLDHGWRCIPLPPTLDEGWEIFDNSHDRRTGWQRTLSVEWVH